MVNAIDRFSVKKLICILITVCFLTYISSFRNEFVWDDHHFFEQNIATQSLNYIKEIFTANTTAGAGVTSNYYRPLTTLSFAIDHQLWGWKPYGLHLTNTFFHSLNGVLLFLLFVLLRFGKAKSFFISLIFLIHPIQTEAVTYLSSRGNIFYLTFLLLSLYLFTCTLYLKTIRIRIGEKTIVIPHSFILFLSFICFPLSILSKEGALTTIPIYAGVLLLFAMQKKVSLRVLHDQYRNHFIVILLCLLTAIVYFTLRLTILNFGDSLNYAGGQDEYSRHLSIRLLTFLTTIPTYVRLLLIPYPLYLERSTLIVKSFFHPMVIMGIGLIFASVSLGLYELYTVRRGWIFFGLIIFFSNLASVSGIIPMTGLLRENWLYMPMIGFYIIIFIIGSFLKNYFTHISHVWYKYIFPISYVLICCIFVIMTIQQNYQWRNDIAYYSHNLRFTQSARLHLNLGYAYMHNDEYDKALGHLQNSIRIDDVYPQAHHNIGMIYLRRHNLEAAEREFLTSLSLDPNYLFVYSPLIAIYTEQHKPEKALPYLERLTKIYPKDLKLIIMYGQYLLEARQIDEANKAFKTALQLSKNDPKLIEAINMSKKELLAH